MKKPALICRAAAFLMGLILICLLLATCVWNLAGELALGDRIYRRTYEAFEDEQLTELHQLVEELSQTYGFNAGNINALLTQDTLRESSARVTEWFHELFAEEPDTNVPAVYFAGIEETVRGDEGFLNRVPENLQRSTARNDIENVLSRRAQSMIFPVRGQLLLAARMEAEKKLDLEKILGLVHSDYLLYVGMGAVVLLILVLMVKNERYALGYIGAALCSFGIILLLGWICVWLLNIPQALMVANHYASSWVKRFFLEILLYLLFWIVPCTVSGCVMMHFAGKSSQKGNT